MDKNQWHGKPIKDGKPPQSGNDDPWHQVLSKIVKEFNGEPKFDVALQRVLSLICNFVGSPSGWIFLQNGAGGYDLTACYDLSSPAKTVGQSDLFCGPCQCQRTLLSGCMTKPVNILQCDRLSSLASGPEGSTKRAVFPLLCGGESLGLLTITLPRQEPFIAEEDLVILSNVSEVIASSIYHSRTRLNHIGLGSNHLKRSEAIQLATYDPITGLLNRLGFQDRVLKYLIPANRRSFTAVLIYFDIDVLENINDRLGQGADAALLIRMATTMCDIFDSTDVVARIGGSKFAVFLPDTRIDEAREKAGKLLQRSRSWIVETPLGPIKPDVSVGIAEYPGGGLNFLELLKRAELALLESRLNGANCIRIFSPDGGFEKDDGRWRALWTQRIEQALRNNQFVLYWQPIHDLRAKKTAFYELLIRLKEPSGHIVGPDVFLPIATLSDQIQQIDFWVVKQAVAILREKSKDCGPTSLTVNLSANSLTNTTFIARLKDVLCKSGIDPSTLVFEITENVSIENFTLAQNHIVQLQSLGYRFALDDFGVGFACFDLLQRLPVDFVKIDGSYFENISQNGPKQELVNAIVCAVQEFNVATVAEFVSNPCDVQVVKELGVDYAQGYYFGKPEPIPVVKSSPYLRIP